MITNKQDVHWLALGTVAGLVVGTSTWVILGFMRPGYSPITEQISVLGVGPNGLVMNSAFVLSGLVTLAGIGGITQPLRKDLGTTARRICAVLLAVSPLGLVWIGFFPMNMLALHTIGAQLALGFPILAFVPVALILRRTPRWRSMGNWLLMASPLTLVLLIGFLTAVPLSVMKAGGEGGYLGLWERALAIEVYAWYAIPGWVAFRGGR